MEIPVPSKPCVDSLYLISKRFRLVNDEWIREDQMREENPFLHGGFRILKRELKLKIYPELHPLLGTNIEIFINGQMIGSGYWYNRRDFLSTFTL